MAPTGPQDARRVALGPGSPLLDARPPRRPRQDREASVERQVADLYALAGFTVNKNSVRGGRPKGITPGIPDLEPHAWRLGFKFSHEVKVSPDVDPQSRQSRAQRDYMLRDRRANVIYVLGDVTAAEDFLVWLGLAHYPARARDGALGPFTWLPRERWPLSPGPNAFDFNHLASRWYASPEHARQVETWGYRGD